MTDTEAIAQVNAMKSEAIAVKAEVTGAYEDVDDTLEALQDVMDNVSSKLSDMQRRVLYVFNNYGG